MIPIPSYGKVYNSYNGRRYTHDILDGPWWAQEKVDGSQISFGLVDGELVIRSKRVRLYPGADHGQFNNAVAELVARKALMYPGHIYRGECLTSPRHNVLAYDRIPRGCVILFDVLTDMGVPVYPDHLSAYAESLGLEAVPCLHSPDWAAVWVREAPDGLPGPWPKGLTAEGPSILGGQREGLVIKRYDCQDPSEPDQPLKYKLTTAGFREKMTGRKDPEAKPRDLVSEAAQSFAVEARYRKALQALRDDGRARGGLQDIGPALKWLAEDMDSEAAEDVGRMLWRGFRSRIIREANSGFVAWYKAQLAEGEYE